MDGNLPGLLGVSHLADLTQEIISSLLPHTLDKAAQDESRVFWGCEVDSRRSGQARRGRATAFSAARPSPFLLGMMRWQLYYGFWNRIVQLI